MPSPANVPSRCVRDVVASVDGDGRLDPRSAPARDWIKRFGASIAALQLDEDERAELGAGDAVLVSAEDECWELRRIDADGEAWLVAADVTDRERRLASELASRRCRALGRMAASVSHDLNNQFNHAMAMAATMGLYVQSEEEQRDLQDLEQGTKVGARILGLLARALSTVPARRARVSSSALIEEALSLVRKSLEHAGIPLDEDLGEGLPDVRVFEMEIVQSVMELLYLVADLDAAKMRFKARVGALEVAGGRERRCVIASCEASGVDAERARAVAQVAALEQGAVRAVASRSGALDCLVTAAFLHRRIGGELRCRLEGDVLALEFCWPCAR